MLREGLVEHCTEKEIGESMCLARDWGNTVLRERLGENSIEREIGLKMC